jgi:hypothetical protein
MASEIATTARIAPAMMAMPPPMKSLVTVAFDIVVSFQLGDGGGVRVVDGGGVALKR